MTLRNAFEGLATEASLDRIADRTTSDGAAVLVGGTQQKFRREFNDPTLAEWDVTTGAGMAVSVSNGNLLVTTGTTINSETRITTKKSFSAPFKAGFGFQISQKIINQEFYVEIVAELPDGSGVDDTVVAAWRIAGSDSVTASVARYEVRNGGAARIQSANTTTEATQTSPAIYEIVLESDEVWFHSRTADGSVARFTSYSKQTTAPDPNKRYRLRYRIVNAGTAPASTTTFTGTHVTCIDYTEMQMEITGGTGSIAAAQAVPIYTTGGSVSAAQSSGANTVQWNAAGWGGFLVADVASAAITTTTTTAAVSPGVSVNVGTYAHSFNVVCTAATGTTPTLDVGVEESYDNGVNWYRVYDFPRIRTTGSWTSPLIRSQAGTRYRYVQTVGGTTPSFTRAINRVQFSSNGPLFRRYVDRSIVLTTLNSTTPTYLTEGADRFMLVLSLGAGGTTMPVLQLEGSEDAGTTWYAIGAPLTGVAASVVRSVFTSEMPAMVRARVTTAAVGTTPDYVAIKAMGA